jgi:hypothetical protein
MWLQHREASAGRGGAGFGPQLQLFSNLLQGKRRGDRPFEIHLTVERVSQASVKSWTRVGVKRGSQAKT